MEGHGMKDLKKFLGVCAFLFVLICAANSLYAAEQEKYLRELKQKREKAE